MPTSPTPIDALPDAPSRDMTDEEFVEAADTWVAAQPTFRTQINSVATTTYDNAVEAATSATNAATAEANAEAAQAAAETAQTLAVGASDYMTTSGSTLTMAAGSKTIVVDEAGQDFAEGRLIAVVYRQDQEVRLYATIDDVSGQTITATVASDGVVGSGGPYDDWLVYDAAFAPVGATAAELRARTSPYVPVTPKTVADAEAEVTLTNSGTNIITQGDAGLDLTKFINGVITLTGNWTLPNPSAGMSPGKTGRIRVVQDGTGSRTLSFGSQWKRSGGAPTLTTTASARDFIVFEVISSTEILYDFLKNPS